MLIWAGLLIGSLAITQKIPTPMGYLVDGPLMNVLPVDEDDEGPSRYNLGVFVGLEESIFWANVLLKRQLLFSAHT